MYWKTVFGHLNNTELTSKLLNRSLAPSPNRFDFCPPPPQRKMAGNFLITWFLRRQSGTGPPPQRTVGAFNEYDFTSYASVNSSSAHPPPPHRADPRELVFFENELANAPPPGQKSCSNAPG